MKGSVGRAEARNPPKNNRSSERGKGGGKSDGQVLKGGRVVGEWNGATDGRVPFQSAPQRHGEEKK